MNEKEILKKLNKVIINEKLNVDILKTCIKIAKLGKGALIVVGDCEYKNLINKKKKPFKFTKNLDFFIKSAIEDGAMILNEDGYVQAYRVWIINLPRLVLKGFGTRHATAMSVSSINENIAYLVSEQHKKIKVFKKGKLLFQVDPFEKDILKNLPSTTKILEFAGAGTIGTFGAGILGLAGVSLIPGIVVFGSLYEIIKRFKVK